jgi:hypothetical protein
VTEHIEIAAYVWLDVKVELDPREIKEAYQKDLDAGADRMSKEEVERFVLGQEDGIAPEDLVKRYPNLDKFLKEKLT